MYNLRVSYQHYILAILLSIIAISSYAQQAKPLAKTVAKKKIVLIAGEKSHPAGTHEYIKTVRLLKTMLDNSNVKGLQTEVHLHGWPADEKTLNTADLIFFISDGGDGIYFPDAPFLTPERIKVLEKQMARGCGLALLHFATFASYTHGQKLLDWSGGYYDWQDASGNKHKYSELKELEGDVQLPSPQHPVSRGVKPFHLKDEFYYNLRFRENAPKPTPILEVPALGGRPDMGNVVAWTLERPDGGRAFNASLSHYYANWQNADFRKVLLNGLVWAAGIEVPQNGVKSRFFSDQEVTQHIYGKTIKALLLTSKDSTAKNWTPNTSLIKSAIETDKRFLVDIATDINDLWQYDLQDYNIVILNRKDTTGINNYSKKALEEYLQNGGGMLAMPFSYSAGQTTGSNTHWPAYKAIFRKDLIETQSPPTKPIQVKVAQAHAVTKGIKPFQIISSNDTQLKGEEPITPVLNIPSNTSKEPQPIAWLYKYGKGRVFQTSLGLTLSNLQSDQVKKLLKNAAVWAAGAADTR